MVPSSRCCMCPSYSAPTVLERFICFDEAPSRARQRRADRSDRELERARDLGVIQSFFSHQQRLAVALDEHVERFPSQRSLLSSFNRERLRFDRLIRSRLLAQQLEAVSPSGILA